MYLVIVFTLFAFLLLLVLADIEMYSPCRNIAAYYTATDV